MTSDGVRGNPQADRVRVRPDGITERLALLHDIAEQSRGLGHDLEAHWIDAAAGAVEALLALADEWGRRDPVGFYPEASAENSAYQNAADQLRDAVAVHLDPKKETER